MRTVRTVIPGGVWQDERVMHKLGIHTPAGLVGYAIREGLVNP